MSLESQRSNLLQIAGAFEQISQRVHALSERVDALERATGLAQTNGDAQPAAPTVTVRPEPRIY